MTTLRKQARQEDAAARRRAIIKPVLTDPFELKWPEVSQAGLGEIEKALRDVLWPLVEARRSQYMARQSDIAQAATESAHYDASGQRLDEMAIDDSHANSIAGSETAEILKADAAIPAAEVQMEATSNKRKLDDTWPKQISKRARVRAAKFAKAERTSAKLQAKGVPPATHEITLRSGRALTVPDNITPERFRPGFLLNKLSAIDSRPAICNALSLGINAVAALLEHDVEIARRELSGLKPAILQKRDYLNLRLFIPALNNSTRRQRRELRQKLTTSKQCNNRKRTSTTSDKRVKCTSAQVLPEFLRNVPVNDSTLLYLLQEALQDVSDRMQAVPPPSCRLVATQAALQDFVNRFSVAEKARGQVRQDAFSSEHEAAMVIDETATVKSKHNVLQASLAPHPTITLPSSLLYTILCGKPTFQALREDHSRKSSLSDTHFDGLSTLLGKYDREWFVAHQRYLIRSAKPAQPLKRLLRENRQLAMHTEQSDDVEIPHNIAFPVSSHFRIIFVCNGDINPLSIVQHILTAAAARNAANISLRQIRAASTSSSDLHGSLEDVYIVPLPKGAESKLADLFGIRRVAAFGLEHCDAPGFVELLRAVKAHLHPPLADWLVPTVNRASALQTIRNVEPGKYVEAHVKHLQVNVPIDPKAQRKSKREHNKAIKARTMAQAMKKRSAS